MCGLFTLVRLYLITRVFTHQFRWTHFEWDVLCAITVCTPQKKMDKQKKRLRQRHNKQTNTQMCFVNFCFLLLLLLVCLLWFVCLEARQINGNSFYWNLLAHARHSAWESNPSDDRMFGWWWTQLITTFCSFLSLFLLWNVSHHKWERGKSKRLLFFKQIEWKMIGFHNFPSRTHSHTARETQFIVCLLLSGSKFWDFARKRWMDAECIHANVNFVHLCAHLHIQRINSFKGVFVCPCKETDLLSFIKSNGKKNVVCVASEREWVMRRMIIIDIIHFSSLNTCEFDCSTSPSGPRWDRHTVIKTVGRADQQQQKKTIPPHLIKHTKCQMRIKIVNCNERCENERH